MRNLITVLTLLVTLAAADCSAQSAPAPEIALHDIHAGEIEALKDRIMYSLMYRGELADKIIDAGLARQLAVLPAESTYSEARLALLEWIKKNPDKAARLALDLQNGIRASTAPVNYQLTSWEINPGFLEKIRALSAAAKDSSASAETLELVTKRLYEGSAEETGGAPVAGGRQQSGGNDFFSKDYADYKLNRAGLDRELAGAGRVLEAMRSSAAGQDAAGKSYEAATVRYGAFVVAASAVKGRSVVTAGESAALERHRTGLRAALAVLILRRRAADLSAIASTLSGQSGRPGCSALSAAIRGLQARLAGLAGRIEAAPHSNKELIALIGQAEEEFASVYLKYFVYSGILGLKIQSEELGFSCVYDYLLWRGLVSVAPETAYVKARAAVKAAESGLDAGLLKAGKGEISAALEGPGGRAEELNAALGLVRRASAANRAAQYFLWGILFRPVELEVSARSGKPFFWPAFTLYSVTGQRSSRHK